MKPETISFRPLVIVLILYQLLGSGCSAIGSRTPAPVDEIRPGILMGYLPQDALPNSLALVPAPPESGSAAFALDEEIAARNIPLNGSAR